MVQPVVLIDVDGVLSPYGTLTDVAAVEAARAADGRPVWGDFTEATVAGLRMCFSPKLMAELRTISERTHMWIVSSWGGSATDLYVPFDLPALPVVIPAGSHNRSWKLQVATRFAEQTVACHQPLAWFDDECGTPANRDLVAATNPDVHVVAPDSMYGISPDQIEDLKTFLNL